MQTTKLIRLGGLSAIMAGVLRTGASFIPLFSADVTIYTELLYLLIDVLILFGLIGIYGCQNEKSGYIGFAGFLMAMTGTALILGPDGKIGSVDVYTTGASIIAIGMLLLAIGSLKAGVLSRLAPILWIVSTVVGISGSLFEGNPMKYGFFIAGISFGAGFVIAGYEVLKMKAASNA